MHAEIIANGDEIISGEILDTNSPWLSRQLEDFGIAVQYHTAVGDAIQDMVDVLRIAMNRVDIVVWTGGLGPTADDLTRLAFANAAEVPLVEDAESLRHIEDVFRQRGAAIPDNFRAQVYQPQGASAIQNPNGTAPGIDFTIQREGRLGFVRLLAYPGVPAEMVEMWNDSGRKTIMSLLDTLRGEKRMIKHRSLHAFGMGESQVENMLSGIVERGRTPKVGITATQGTITLRIVAEAETEPECDALIEPTAKKIYEALGTLIFGEGEDTLADVVCRMANLQGKTIAVVESGTSGLLAKALGSSSESASCFLGGVVLPQRTPITPERMIAIGQRMFNADYMLLVGAYPEGRPARNRSEETFVALVNAPIPESETSILQRRDFRFVGHPDIVDDLYVSRALDIFRLHFR